MSLWLFFFSSRRRHTRLVSDWSSDVCSSDLRARLRQREVALGEHRRLAERMHFAQRRGREHGLRIALVALDLIRKLELLEQPQHALRARVVEVMDHDHGLCSARIRSKRRSGASHISATTTYSVSEIQACTNASGIAAA